MSVVIQSWLDIQCRTLPGIVRAIVLLDDAVIGARDGFAAWPQNAEDCTELLSIAHAFLDRNREQRQPIPQVDIAEQPSRSFITYPLCGSARLNGVLVAEIPKRLEGKLDAFSTMLEWGSLWLEFARQLKLDERSNDLFNLIRLMIACLEPREFRHSAMAFVNQLNVLFGCTSVGLGLLKSKHISLYTLSNSVKFDPQSHPALALTAAMNEAVDQTRILVFPPVVDGRSAPILRAHAELAQEHGVGALLTIPLACGNRLIGALTLERQHEPFDTETVKLCQFVAMLAGSILGLKRENDRGPLTLLADSIRNRWEKLFGAGHSKYKAASVLLAVSLLFLTVFKSDYRVSTDAILEGTVQRVVVSPIDGYIAGANVRPGDVVRQGAIVGALDDKDIKLEHLRWANQYQQHEREYREAMALHDRSKVSILSAQSL